MVCDKLDTVSYNSLSPGFLKPKDESPHKEYVMHNTMQGHLSIHKPSSMLKKVTEEKLDSLEITNM